MRAFPLLFSAFLCGAAFAACSGDEAASGSSSGSGGGSSSTTTSSQGGGATTTSTTTSTTSSTSSGLGIDCMSAYTNMPVGECDLLQQDCPTGETCRPRLQDDNISWSTECVAGSGLKAAGESCQTEGECQTGLFCTANKCAAICCPDNNQPCNGGGCTLDVSWNNTEYFTMMCSYSQQCQLFVPNTCPPGEECHLENSNEGLVTCLAPSDNQVDEGGTCKYLNDCKENQWCLTQQGDMTGICRYLCDAMLVDQPAGSGGCPDGQTCHYFAPFAPKLGSCQPG